MYHKYYTKQFQKSFIKLLSSGKIKRDEIENAVDILSSGKRLPKKYENHGLQGVYRGYSDCHVRGDIVLIYKLEKDKLVLILVDIGSHSKIF
ncbi:MAG: type II toxin-antitoxin system YafQ family toxin [Candidatus Moranbacteria bacterium]|nr:type II toxin-antitoxin system YafQ family toxin [Candidatus Moranbacteria bacterium]